MRKLIRILLALSLVILVLTVTSISVSADEWTSPTSFNDPDGAWTSEFLTYDEDINTYAGTGLTGNWLELIPDASLLCNLVRVNMSTYRGPPFFDDRNVSVKMDVYYEGSWHNIHDGYVAGKTWDEIPIPAGIKTVERARVLRNAIDTGSTRLYEFDFWEITPTESETADSIIVNTVPIIFATAGILGALLLFKKEPIVIAIVMITTVIGLVLIQSLVIRITS